MVAGRKAAAGREFGSTLLTVSAATRGATTAAHLPIYGLPSMRGGMERSYFWGKEDC